MEKVYSNIFYFKYICKIGGTEQFLWELAKKYYKYDITVVCDRADEYQLQRLRKLVRAIVRKPDQKFKCKKAFLNFNADLIPFLEAEKIIFVSHAIFQEIGYHPPIHHEEITDYIAVSKYAAAKLDEFASKELNKEIHTKYTYNPLTLEPKEKVIRIVSAGRLDDKTKDNGRSLILIDALDRYAKEHNRHYVWMIFSNPISFQIESPNVVLMKPRLDVRPYIADADFVAQLSNDMETFCYTDQEALGYGVRIITTPMTINKELKVPKEANLICEWDMSNVDEIVKRIFEEEYKSFEYKVPEDHWEDFLILNKSDYEEEKRMKVKVKVISEFTDIHTGTLYPVGTELIITKERMDEILTKGNLVEFIEDVVEKEIKKERAVRKDKVEKNIL